MKAVIIPFLFLALVAVYATHTEMQYHPQAILRYLEYEDQQMAQKVRSIVKLEDANPLKRRGGPSGFPTVIPPAIKFCLKMAYCCHRLAKDDACAHLKCIAMTGLCLHKAGLRIEHLPPSMKKCLPIIPCCLLGSETCEEKLCCFVRFGECAKKLGDKEDRK